MSNATDTNMPYEPATTVANEFGKAARIMAVFHFLCENTATKQEIIDSIEAFDLNHHGKRDSARKDVDRIISALRDSGIEIHECDQKYYIDANEITATLDFTVEEIDLLFAFSNPQLENDSFPYKQALRTALTKIGRDRKFSGAEVYSSAAKLQELYNQRNDKEISPSLSASAVSMHSISSNLAEANAKEEEMAAKITRAIQDAIKNCQQISFGYTDGQKEETTRTVEPYKLYTANGKMYLYCKCLLRNEPRSFSLDRMSLVKPVKNSHFEMPEDLDISAIRRLPFTFGKDDPFDITLCIAPYAEGAKNIVESYAQANELRELPDGTYIWFTSANSIELLFEWTIKNGPGVFVLEPAWAKEKCMEFLRVASKEVQA